jgi:transcriptional regulator with XRE-family HTH domain
MTANKKTTDIDRKIGALIRKHRQDKGWALTNLAAEIGVTYQQLQKYERGVSRVSASRLYDIAKELNVPVASFFPAPSQKENGAP